MGKRQIQSVWQRKAFSMCNRIEDLSNHETKRVKK